MRRTAATLKHAWCVKSSVNDGRLSDSRSLFHFPSAGSLRLTGASGLGLWKADRLISFALDAIL